MYDFDVNKKNNLIFNGIARQNGEDVARLTGVVQDIIKKKLNISRFIDIVVKLKIFFEKKSERIIQNVSRLDTGPSLLKCRPVLVSFRNFKDREDILKASKFLKVSDSSIYITEEIKDIL